MSAKKTKATTELIAPGKKAKTDLPPGEITTYELFQAYYPIHTIENSHNFFCTSGWDTPEGLTEITAWLKLVAGEQVKIYGQIKRGSAAALYTLIMTTLLPVFDLCDITASENLVHAIGQEALGQIASEIIEPRRISREADGSELPETIHTSNEEEVMQFIKHIEKWKKNSSESSMQPRVQVLLRDNTTDNTVAVIEATPHINNFGEPCGVGFFQCCAYMARHDIPFGIYTDHQTFQFVRMDESQVLHHSTLFGMMKPDYLRLDEDAPEVYARLFEIMGVPRNTDLSVKAAESAIMWEQAADVLTARLM
eukprot:gene41274-50375_t